MVKYCKMRAIANEIFQCSNEEFEPQNLIDERRYVIGRISFVVANRTRGRGRGGSHGTPIAITGRHTM